MICSFRFKKDVLILKMSLCILCFWFFLKPYPIQVIISIPMWIKLTMCQLLLFFLCNFCSLFSYAGSVLVKAPFFHRYWFIYFDYSANYDTQRVFVINFLISNDLLNCFRSVATIVNINRKWLKQPQNHFNLGSSQKSQHFLLFRCILCMATPDISIFRENLNNTARVSRLLIRFL